jgi:membrane protein YdbS with pleckstrin-like domain
MMTEPPRLAREIGKVAWLFARVTGCVGAVIVLFAWLFSNHVTAGLITLYALIFAAMIGYIGWQTYTWKKKDWEYQCKERQQREERERELAAHLAKLKSR